ncbi:MAG TPA: Rieske (2Fe-2S) protein [Pyrinomonadaceae bacterium]|nr:Rieske (2Fe-2S) protein [Pyrinomonadaceae bacterium]
MTEKTEDFSTKRRAADESPDPARRKLLLWVPAAVFASIAVSVASAAFRFLRPQATAEEPGAANNSADWSPIAPVAELSGAQPLLRRVAVEHRAGWSATRREHIVYVLPHQNNRVVSAVCPHEGCEVDWQPEAGEFLCPCHDSRFTAAGARLNGPAEHDLFQLPSRVENGVLQVLYKPGAPEAAQGQSPVRG